MRSALGFGLLVTAALIALEAGTGIPRNALDAATAHMAEAGFTGFRVTAAGHPPTGDALKAGETGLPSDEMPASSVYDPIPSIARTVAIADPSPPRAVKPDAVPGAEVAARAASTAADVVQSGMILTKSAAVTTAVVAATATAAAVEAPVGGVAAAPRVSPTGTTAKLATPKRPKTVQKTIQPSRTANPVRRSSTKPALVTVHRGTQASVVSVQRLTKAATR